MVGQLIVSATASVFVGHVNSDAQGGGLVSCEDTEKKSEWVYKDVLVSFCCKPSQTCSVTCL